MEDSRPDKPAVGIVFADIGRIFALVSREAINPAGRASQMSVFGNAATPMTRNGTRADRCALFRK
jgi:hypothetical protein